MDRDDYMEWQILRKLAAEGRLGRYGKARLVTLEKKAAEAHKVRGELPK